MAKRKKHWSDVLVRMGACREAVRWCRKKRSLKSAWGMCAESRWMEWLGNVLIWGPGARTEKVNQWFWARSRPGETLADQVRRYWPNPPPMRLLERAAKENETESLGGKV